MLNSLSVNIISFRVGLLWILNKFSPFLNKEVDKLDDNERVIVVENFQGRDIQ